VIEVPPHGVAMILNPMNGALPKQSRQWAVLLPQSCSAVQNAVKGDIPGHLGLLCHHQETPLDIFTRDNYPRIDLGS